MFYQIVSLIRHCGDDGDADGRVGGRWLPRAGLLLGEREQLLPLLLLLPRLLAERPGGVEDVCVEDDEDAERDPVVADDEGGVEDGVLEELHHALAGLQVAVPDEVLPPEDAAFQFSERVYEISWQQFLALLKSRHHHQGCPGTQGDLIFAIFN